MGIRFGPFDPLQLIFGIMDNLMRKGLITYAEARGILRQAMPSDNEMSPEEKDKIIDSMVRENPPQGNPQ
jgi:hypothetical protein